MVGVDLFCGAGGMSLGAKLAGVRVTLAVEADPHAATTYALNHPEVRLIRGDIRAVNAIPPAPAGEETILFGGPPCQGFSTSNQRTRSRNNRSNWMFQEFLRLPSYAHNMASFSATTMPAFLTTVGMASPARPGQLAKKPYSGGDGSGQFSGVGLRIWVGDSGLLGQRAKRGAHLVEVKRCSISRLIAGERAAVRRRACCLAVLMRASGGRSEVASEAPAAMRINSA